jgi:hypothetical protein
MAHVVISTISRHSRAPAGLAAPLRLSAQPLRRRTAVGIGGTHDKIESPH